MKFKVALLITVYEVPENVSSHIIEIVLNKIIANNFNNIPCDYETVNGDLLTLSFNHLKTEKVDD